MLGRRYTIGLHSLHLRSFISRGYFTFVNLTLSGALVLGAISAPAQDTLPIVKDYWVIGPSDGYGAFDYMPDSVRFGNDLAGMGDLDGDGVADIAIGNSNDELGNAADTGSVWILFLNANGSVKDHTRIKSNTNGFNVTLDPGDAFGGRLANIGDLDLDGHTDLAVLASGDDDGATNQGAVYILFLRDTVISSDTVMWVNAKQKISDTQGDFGGSMTNETDFNAALENVGDLDGDGIQDLAVGANGSDRGGTDRGALWILHLARNGKVKSSGSSGYYLYAATTGWGSPTGGNPLTTSTEFGFSVARLGDLDGDAVPDIAVTSRIKDSRGAIYIMFRNSDGTIKSYQKIGGNPLSGGLTTTLSSGGNFGFSIESVGDMNADGVVDLIVGLRLQDDGYTDAGAAMVLYLNTNGTVHAEDVISDTHGTGGGDLDLHADANFGFAVADLGDVDGDKVHDIAVNAQRFDAGGEDWAGRVYVIELNAKPLLAPYVEVDETASVKGSITWQAVGGVRPYRVVNGETFPTRTEFEDAIDGLDTTGFSGLGFPGMAIKAAEYEDLVLGSVADHDTLDACLVGATVIDAREERVSHLIPVGYAIQAGTSTGVSFNSAQDVKRTASNGSSMEFTTANILAPGAYGWIDFTVPQKDSIVVVGMREHDATASSGYLQMLFGVYFNGTTFKLRYGGSLHGSGTAYATTDHFTIELIDDSVYFKRNEERFEAILMPTTSKGLIADVYIAKKDNKIGTLKSSMKKVAVHASIAHDVCFTEAFEGAIDLTVFPSTGTTYAWTKNGGAFATTQDISGLEIGVYTVTITTSSAGTAVRTYRIGFEAMWGNKYQCHTDASATHTLIKDDPSDDPTLPGHASAMNHVLDAASDWIQFQPSGTIPGGFTVMCGLRNHTDAALSSMLLVHDAPGTVPPIYMALDAGGLVGPPFALGSSMSPTVSLTFGPPSGVLTVQQEVPLGPGVSLPSAYGSLAHVQVFSTILQDGRRNNKVVSSFGCGALQFARVEPDLTDRIHYASNERLDFIHQEDYNASALDYEIKDLEGNVLLTETDIPWSIQYGYNEVSLPLVDWASGIYVLQTTDQKGLKHHLRFHYEGTTP